MGINQRLPQMLANMARAARDREAIADALATIWCQQCQHLKKGKSPINIGFEAFANPVDEDLKELGGTRAPELRLPEGFCLDERGRVCAIIGAKRVRGGIQPAHLVALISNRIGPPSNRPKRSGKKSNAPTKRVALAGHNARRSTRLNRPENRAGLSHVMRSLSRCDQRARTGLPPTAVTRLHHQSQQRLLPRRRGIG